MCHAKQPVQSSLPEISMFWPSTTEPSGPGGRHFGASTKSKKILSPERTSRDCLLIRFSEISFKPSLDPCFWPLVIYNPVTVYKRKNPFHVMKKKPTPLVGRAAQPALELTRDFTRDRVFPVAVGGRPPRCLARPRGSRMRRPRTKWSAG